MEYGLSEKESKASESFLLAAFLNLAMCYLKLREYTKAVECCDKVAWRGWAAEATPLSSLTPGPPHCCSPRVKGFSFGFMYFLFVWNCFSV